MTDWTGLDPKLFDPAAIDPETAAFNARLEAQLAALPSMTLFQPQVIRDARESGKSIFGPIVRSERGADRTLPGPAGAIPIRVFRPEGTARGVYLHLHGGGWVLGRPHHQDARHEEIARNCQVAVVSVDYRLAPEDPYPAGPDDCEAAALWLIRNARAEFGTDRLIIGGESAGAHLSAVTLIRLRDRHDVPGFAAANLVYGAYDLTMTPTQSRWGDRNLVLSTPIIKWFSDHYVPADRRRDPDVSPLHADLTGLPPALFSVGTQDPLLDDSLFMYARWLAAGNRAELAIYPGGVHAFDAFDIPIARQARERLDAFIRDAVR